MKWCLCDGIIIIRFISILYLYVGCFSFSMYMDGMLFLFCFLCFGPFRRDIGSFEQGNSLQVYHRQEPSPTFVIFMLLVSFPSSRFLFHLVPCVFLRLGYYLLGSQCRNYVSNDNNFFELSQQRV